MNIKFFISSFLIFSLSYLGLIYNPAAADCISPSINPIMESSVEARRFLINPRILNLTPQQQGHFVHYSLPYLSGIISTLSEQTLFLEQNMLYHSQLHQTVGRINFLLTACSKNDLSVLPELAQFIINSKTKGVGVPQISHDYDLLKETSNLYQRLNILEKSGPLKGTIFQYFSERVKPGSFN